MSIQHSLTAQKLHAWQLRVMTYQDLVKEFIVPELADMQKRIHELQADPVLNAKRIKYLEERHSKLTFFSHQANTVVKEAFDLVQMLVADVQSMQVVYDQQAEFVRSLCAQGDIALKYTEFLVTQLKRRNETH